MSTVTAGGLCSGALLLLLLLMELFPQLPSACSVPGMDGALKVLGLSDLEQGRKKSVGELPFMTVSFAQTLDGSIAPVNRSRLDISSRLSFRLLHSLRARHDGVLVGINTVICDQPRLNVRDPLPGVTVPSLQQQPRPIVIDSELRILQVEDLRLDRPLVCSCLLDGSTTSAAMDQRWLAARAKVEARGGRLVSCKRDAAGRCDMHDCLRLVKEHHGLQSVLVEGGAGIIQSVLELDLVDQFVVTLRPCFFGGYRALTRQLSSPTNMNDISVASIGGDVVLHGVVVKRKRRIGDVQNSLSDFGEEVSRPLVRLVV